MSEGNGQSNDIKEESTDNCSSKDLDSEGNILSQTKEISQVLLNQSNGQKASVEDQTNLNDDNKQGNFNDESNCINFDKEESSNNDDDSPILNEKAMQNIKKRCIMTKNRNSLQNKNKITFCNLPPAAKISKSVTRPQTSTMVTFSKALRNPSLYDPTVLYYKDRESFEEKQKKEFDLMIHEKYYINSIHSPYKCDFCDLRKKSIKKTKLDLKKRDFYDRRERYFSTKQYLKEAKESIEHDDKLVKKDYFPVGSKCLRILAV